MRKPSIGKSLLATTAMVSFAAACIIGCGNTDGGSAVERYAGLGTRYVSDGGAGGSIAIDIIDSLAVGETSPFSVTLRDAQGQPLQFVRVFCESEHGIAILEPSKGGTAFEHTNGSGYMSGVIGGMSPGSYVMECRAPIEYNLIARVSVKITGEVPVGFEGWPGAAGGNLGGGYTIPPDVIAPDDGSGGDDDDPNAINGIVRVSQILFTDLGVSRLWLDIEPDLCVEVTPGTPPTYNCFPEPFFENSYKVTIENGTLNKVEVEEFTYVVTEGITGTHIVTVAQDVSNEILSGATRTYEGQLTASQITSTTPKQWANSNRAVDWGSYNITFTFRGYYLETGEPFSATSSQFIHFENINNCPEGSINYGDSACPG